MTGGGEDWSASIDDPHWHQLVGCEGTGLVEQTMRDYAIEGGGVVVVVEEKDKGW